VTIAIAGNTHNPAGFHMENVIETPEGLPNLTRRWSASTARPWRRVDEAVELRPRHLHCARPAPFELRQDES
jgi:hypothetical protein